MKDSVAVPRKLLMTADTTGDAWIYAVELARGLAESGVEVVLATLGTPLDEPQREMAERIPRIRVFESALRPEWMEDAWRDVKKAGEWLLRLEERLAPDLIHLNSYVHAVLPWNAPAVIAGHSCMLSWWKAVKGEPAPDAWERYSQAVADGLAAAELVITPTQARLESLAEQYGELPRTRVIPNARDARQFRPGGKEPMIFAAGRLEDEARNLEALERVAPRLPWPVFVAGENHHPDGGEARPHHSRVLGRLSQRALAAWLGRASIYCAPARYEPFGLGALEAALSGCALVLGDIPSLREIWRHRAVFVPPDDPEALEDALKRLIEDPDRRSSLTAGARARALQLSPSRMVEAYLAAYGDVLGEKARADLDGAGPDYVAQIAV